VVSAQKRTFFSIESKQTAKAARVSHDRAASLLCVRTARKERNMMAFTEWRRARSRPNAVHSNDTSERTLRTLALTAALVLGACNRSATIPFGATTGPNPHLPPPEAAIVPTIHVASGVGWPQGRTPIAADGLAVEAFATGLDHPRWLLRLPNGDILVAETAAPERPEAGKGLKGKVMQATMKRTGSAVPSANRITLLRDADRDGRAELKTTLLENLVSPFGMELVGGDLYVANADAIVRVPYRDGDTRITTTPQKVTDLPGGPLNHHWTKNIVASPDGKRLFAAVGSNSNVAEHGIEKEEGRAAIWEVDLATSSKRLYATGLRNPVGMAFEPRTQTLWTVVNERDELGNDLVPDYLTSVREGAFYGWPYSYFGQHVDERVKPPRPDLVAAAVKPDYSLGSHVAALGLAFSENTSLPAEFASGAFIGEHGSWNRKPRSGYQVVFVPFRGGRPEGVPRLVLGGFIDDKEDKAFGRPVGVELDAEGALLVADDVGNTVWRVTSAGQGATR
jgi:glucose/arabinose dehydrogenase